MFSLEQLLFAIANDQRSKDDTIVKVLPMLNEVYQIEKENRQALKVNLQFQMLKSFTIFERHFRMQE